MGRVLRSRVEGKGRVGGKTDACRLETGNLRTDKKIPPFIDSFTRPPRFKASRRANDRPTVLYSNCFLCSLIAAEAWSLLHLPLSHTTLEPTPSAVLQPLTATLLLSPQSSPTKSKRASDRATHRSRAQYLDLPALPSCCCVSAESACPPCSFETGPQRKRMLF